MQNQAIAAKHSAQTLYLGKPHLASKLQGIPAAKEARTPARLPVDTRMCVDYLDDKRHRAQTPGRIEMLEQGLVRISHGDSQIEIMRTKLKRWLRGRDPDGYSMLVHNNYEVNLRVNHIIVFLKSTENI